MGCRQSTPVAIISQSEFASQPSAVEELRQEAFALHGRSAPVMKPSAAQVAPAPDLHSNGVESGSADELAEHARQRQARRRRKKTLIKSAKNGDMEGLRELLEGGAAVDERGMWESTPLLCAAQYRHEEAVRLLLEHGADPGAANERGCTPLLHACVEGLETAAELLLERGAPVNVERAVVYNHARDCNQLLTPLHAACGNGYAPIVSLLLRHGANAGARWQGRRETTSSQQVKAACRFEAPLAVACRYGHGEVVKRLLQDKAARATADDADSSGRTPLVYACAAGLAGAAAALIDAGARVEGVGDLSTGETPLLQAAHRGLSEVVALLAQRGAPLDEQDSRGRTALFLAAEGGHTTCVSALVVAGAATEVTDAGGTTPLARAEQLGHDDAAALLRPRTPAAGPHRPRLAPLKGVGGQGGDGAVRGGQGRVEEPSSQQSRVEASS